MRALCEPVARLLSKNMTCARPRCNATPSKHFLHTSHFTLHSSHLALRTSHLYFTLHTHLIAKTCELFSPHLTSSHLIPSLLTCHLDKFFSTVFISSEHSSTFLISPKFFSTHLSCSARQKALTVSEKSLAQKTIGRRKLLHTDAFTQKPLQNTLCYKACTQHFPALLLYRKACTKHFPVLLCTTKLAQSMSQYYFVPQMLHRALPSTSLYYQSCAKYFQALLCTTKLAQSTSQYYFILQSLHKVRPSTTLYYQVCTKYFPVLLCTTKFAQSTYQYYFVLQSLHKILPSTTLY